MSILNTIISPFLKIYLNFQSKRRLPKTDGTIEMHGITAEVKITRDKWGVPHIQASNDQDLFFAQGYAHAQDRLWQMELNRRTANGTLSELFGEVTLETDRLSRIMGFHQLGKKDWENLFEEGKRAFKAYVKGVNTFIDSLDTKDPLELSLIKHKPALWEPEDCMAISRLMIWQLSHAWYGEVIRTKIIDAVGEEHAADLEITYPEDNPITLPEGIEFKSYVKGKLKKISGPFIDQNMGSNSWVISADKSATGKPILANDMHLAQRLPSLWYVNHLRSDNTNVTGVSAPGMPMVLVGHNQDIAWGATLSYIDCEDLYVEELSEDGTQYKVSNKWEDIEVRREIINIKDALNVQIKVQQTRHGPIISPLLDDQQEPITLQSKSLQPLTSIEGWYRLNKAGNWDEFVEAISYITAPALNFTYADNTNIGYYCSGRVPIRKSGDGRLPREGWSTTNDWDGEIPFEEMPHALNPEQGYIISCNNKQVSNDYPHDLGGNWMNGYRAARLENYFESSDELDIETCKTMQQDIFSIPGRKFIEYYKDLEVDDPNPKVGEALEIMKEWNGILDADSIGAAVYEVTKFMAIRILLEKHLGKELSTIYMGIGPDDIVLPAHEFYGHDTVVLFRLLEEEDNWWIKHVGGRDKLLLRAFNRAFEWLMNNVDLDINKWTWGSIHQIEFIHPMSLREPLDRVFNRGPFPVGGDMDTPNQMATRADDPFGAKSWVPSWRQIVDLGDMTRSLAMFAPGQSGHLASDHYDDLIKPWLEGKYFTQLWTRGQIENNSKSHLVLEPIF